MVFKASFVTFGHIILCFPITFYNSVGQHYAWSENHLHQHLKWLDDLKQAWYPGRSCGARVRIAVLSLSVCVCSCFRLFFSFSVPGVCSAFLKSFNSVSRKFERCWKFQWCFKEVFRVLQGSEKGVSRNFQGRLKVFFNGFQWVSRAMKISSMGVWGKFQWSFKAVSKTF